MEALLTSIVLVAVAEIGDKTQLLSFVLAARLRKPWPIIGGMMLADVPAVWVGEKLAARIPMKAVRLFAAALFVVVGGITLWGAYTTAK